MGEMFVGLFLGLVAPLWLIFHYITKWKTSKGLSTQDQKLLEELYQTAQAMEHRIETLETILDERAEGWRAEHASRDARRT